MGYLLDPKMTLQSNRKQGHYKNIVHLWEFLMELLEKETCRSIVTWTRKDVWEFKIQNSRELAERWGSFKKNSHMNYEHLSRSLRYYYKKGILHKVGLAQNQSYPLRGKTKWKQKRRKNKE